MLQLRNYLRTQITEETGGKPGMSYLCMADVNADDFEAFFWTIISIKRSTVDGQQLRPMMKVTITICIKGKKIQKLSLKGTWVGLVCVIASAN